MTFPRQILRSPRSLICGLALLLTLGSASGNLRADEPLPTEEVVAELMELTTAVTPFTVRYDPEIKALVFNEVVESNDKALSGRIGELQARLDRMDPTKMRYEASTAAFVVTVQGKRIVGRMIFHCRSGEKCVRRGMRDATTPALIGEESAEEGFTLDVVGEAVTIDQLLRFAALVRHLITISSSD